MLGDLRRFQCEKRLHSLYLQLIRYIHTIKPNDNQKQDGGEQGKGSRHMLPTHVEPGHFLADDIT